MVKDKDGYHLGYVTFASVDGVTRAMAGVNGIKLKNYSKFPFVIMVSLV